MGKINVHRPNEIVHKKTCKEIFKIIEMMTSVTNRIIY